MCVAMHTYWLYHLTLHNRAESAKTEVTQKTKPGEPSPGFLPICVQTTQN
jgi:hypothetical protein